MNYHENVKITASWVVIENIYTTSAPVSYDAGCDNQPAGWRVGFRFMSGAAYNVLRYSEADNQYIGILIEAGAHHNHILYNTLLNNRMKDENYSSDAGAVGISLMGDDNEVGWNVISGSDMCSRQHGRDGAAVEVYGGSRNRIHHNTAAQNHNFTELGKVPSADNTFAYNRVTSSLTTANFLVTRGASNTYGPVYRTKVLNNVVSLSGSQSYAVQCYGGCSSSILSLRGNIIWSDDRVGYADHAFDEGNNIYWASNGAPKVWFPIASTSKKANPLFVDRGRGDLHLQSASPAINNGGTAALTAGFATDLDLIAVPQGGATDAGGYERLSGGTVAPPPTTVPAPTTTLPTVRLAATSVSASSVPAGVHWGLASSSDGLRRYDLQVSVDGGAYTTLALASPTATGRAVTLTSGHRYTFRVRAVDLAGRIGSWRSTTMRGLMVSDASTAVTYGGSWGTASFSTYLGGKVHYARVSGPTATLRFSGAAIAIVGPRGPGRGRSAIYVDGKYLTTIDQSASTFVARRMLLVRNLAAGTHTIVVKVLGTAGRPIVAIDAFEVLGPA